MGSATTPELESWIKALFWDSNHDFLYLSVVFTVFFSFEPSLGRDMLPPPRDLHPLLYLHWGGNLERHFVATWTMLAILLSFH